MRNTFTWIYCLFFSLLSLNHLMAQRIDSLTLGQCGIAPIPARLAQELVQQANLALEKKRASGAAFTAITYVPIRPHILRKSDGSGGFSLANLNQVMAITNSYYLYNGYGIQFYFAGTVPDYIDNDQLFNGFPYPEDSSIDGRDAPNAMNQYYVNRFTNSGLGGFAYYPADGLYSTRSFITTAPAIESVEDLGNRLIPHELGHSFNLIHTFGPNNGTDPSTELVTRGAGANCSYAGDYICDTPADPYLRAGANYIYPNGCVQYDLSSTARDANGQAYAPSVTNIMSYYFPCTHDFTPGQYDRMQAGLALRQQHTSYSLNAPPTNVSPASALAYTLNGNAVTVRWQDNADNEMGYFIERSTSPTDGFVPIGGVAPNETTFIDTKTQARTQYYYRIRPSNTTTGSLSPTLAVLIPGLTTYVSGNTAQLSWAIAGSSFEVQWRAQGSSNWILINGLTTTTTTLSYLTSGTTYEWRVRATGSDTYSETVRFTIPCLPPSYSSVTPLYQKAYLYWSPTIAGHTYTLRWRESGSPDWTTVSNLTTTPYSLTNLSPTIMYEWQVQSVCSPTERSDFTSVGSFSSLPCQAPYSLQVSYAWSSVAYVYWSQNFYDVNRTNELRYRTVGTTEWNSIAGISTSGYSLTGLTNNTAYEWQVRSICSPLDQSSFSTSHYFSTSCSIPIGLSSRTTATAAVVSCYLPGSIEPGSTYDVQYRPQGSADWRTIGDQSSGTFSLTGLTTNVTYEWRVRHGCAAGAKSDFSPVATFTPRCNAPQDGAVYVSYITSSSVRFFWYIENEAGTMYEIRYKPVGSPTWTTVSSLTGTTNNGSYDLTGLSNATTYEWQVRTTCSAEVSSSFVTGTNFTTQCRIPDALGVYEKTPTTATLSWNQMGIGVTYDVRYRPVGGSWVTLTNYDKSYLLLSGLLTNTTYEWQLRTNCQSGQFSAYSPLTTFATLPCSSPSAIGGASTTDSSATLNWFHSYGAVGTQAEIRFRIVGSANWRVISNIPLESRGYYTYTVTKLASSTQYEWQIRVLCSATEFSDYSTLYPFSTKTYCPVMYTVKSGGWNEASTWSCNREPVATDVLHLKHAVSLPNYYQAYALRIIYDEPVSIRWGVGSQLLLKP